MKYRWFKTAPIVLSVLLTAGLTVAAHGQEMETMWGDRVVKLRADNAKRGQLFDEGNYAMFIHWGLYSNLANKVEGKTYYGIGEWIMNKRMADIPPESTRPSRTILIPSTSTPRKSPSLQRMRG